MSGEQQSGEDARRFTYEFVTYGDHLVINTDYDTLEEAIEEMAADGWRFVESADYDAVFEKPT